MTLKELEDLLEATRHKLAEQGRIVDARLLEKERMLEQAVIDARLDEPDEEQDLHNVGSTDELKDYLAAYLGDLEYWCGLDVESVNHYTNGTPEFASIKELREYHARLASLMKEQDE
jgi:hypothetical protein